MIPIKFIDFLKSFLVAIIYVYIIIYIGYNDNVLFFSSMIFGSFFLFLLFSPAHSLAFTLMFVIDPFGFSGLSLALIIPFSLCFLILFFNLKYSLKLLKVDKNFFLLLKCIAFFSFYQFCVSYLIKGIPDLNYLFSEMKFWLAVWIIIPVYIITYSQYKTFLSTIFIIVIINILVYYLSIFGVVELFEIRLLNRIQGDADSVRLIIYDLRQITKIFVYISPLYAVYYFWNKSSWVIILTGAFIFLAVLIAMLRTELFYLIMGAITSLYLGKKYLFKSNAYLKLGISGFAIYAIFIYLFPGLSDVYNFLYEDILNLLQNESNDSSGQYRLNVQLPVLIEILSNNIFFGGGKFSMSYDNTGHHLLHDIPILGGFGAYGLIGMCIYYTRFILIFKRIKILQNFKLLFQFHPNEILIVLGLLSYFLTMLLFRTLHLNIELAFETGQVEFGLFMGVFFSMTRFLYEKEKMLILNNK